MVARPRTPRIQMGAYTDDISRQVLRRLRKSEQAETEQGADGKNRGSTQYASSRTKLAASFRKKMGLGGAIGLGGGAVAVAMNPFGTEEALAAALKGYRVGRRGLYLGESAVTAMDDADGDDRNRLRVAGSE